jgi:hypothetical protein
MVRHASLFSQQVALFNRQRFPELVFRQGYERYAKGLSSWDQFVGMLFCQIGQAKSLREIIGGLASSFEKLRHSGVKAAPNKSTLSYANAHRPWQLFQDLLYETLRWCLDIDHHYRTAILPAGRCMSSSSGAAPWRAFWIATNVRLITWAAFPPRCSTTT